MKSIESGIRGGLVLSLLLSFALLALVADYGVRQLSYSFVATRLQHDADNLIRALQPQPAAGWGINTQALPVVYQRVRSGHYYQVRTDTQSIRSRSLWEQQPPLTPLAPGTQALRHQYPQQQHWLVWQQGIEKQGQSITLWLAEDIAPLERQWRQFSWILYAVMGLALALLVLVQRRLIRQGFRGLDQLQRDIRQLKHGAIDQLSAPVPAEIQPLTDEINQLLERLAQHTSRSRTAIGNLAHELKHRLQRLSLLQAQLPADQRVEFEQVLGELRHLTEREMQRARIAGESQPGRHFQPDSDLPVMVDMLRRIYPERAIELQLETHDALPLDRDDMLELIGNLADNACKFGQRRVVIQLTAAPRELTIQVSNDGLALSAEQVSVLMERGVRADESSDGFGLGLSICKMIVDSYHGTIAIASESLADRPAETRLTVRIPY